MIMIAKNYIEFRFRLFWDTLYIQNGNTHAVPYAIRVGGGGGSLSRENRQNQDTSSNICNNYQQKLKLMIKIVTQASWVRSTLDKTG